MALLAALLAAPGGFEGLQFLQGEWIGEGTGTPGQSSGGGYSFLPELGGRILVRKNRAEYAAARDHPAFVHEDLMVVYPGAAGKPASAIYWDNEGHVIHYAVTAAAKSAIFLSDPDSSGMRYRLTYISTGPDSVSILFEIGPPGKPLQKYIQAAARRK